MPMTMGMSLVAVMAARVGGVLIVTITSTLIFTSSVARSGSVRAWIRRANYEAHVAAIFVAQFAHFDERWERGIRRCGVRTPTT